VATLRGRVLAGGAPAAGATVMLGSTSSVDSEWIATTTCDASGRYELGPLSPGEVLALAAAEGELIPRVLLVELEPAGITTADFEFSGQSVRGLAIDHESRQPVAGVPLRLGWMPLADADQGTAGVPTASIWELLHRKPYPRAVLVSDHAGRFDFRNLPPGRYSVSVENNWWISRTNPQFVVDAVWSTDDIVLEVSTGAVVEGRFNVSGAGFDEATRHYEVGLYHPTENTVYKFADVDGDTYRLQGLHAGSYALRVRRMDAVGGNAGGGTVFDQPIVLADDEVRRVDIVVED
ncbi:MAG TPA: carboxypeptidase-like regulatory domain-containing protein, partial [Planctomycetota bacterium]|nr:carboxypeptidase-like regulatory domain-containing protein [Planctomycetota bacterium]